MPRADFDRIAEQLTIIFPLFKSSASYKGYLEAVQRESEGAIWHTAVWVDFLGFLRNESGFKDSSSEQARQLARYINELYETYDRRSHVIYNVEFDFFEAFAGWVALTEVENQFIANIEKQLAGEALKAYLVFRKARHIADLNPEA